MSPLFRWTMCCPARRIRLGSPKNVDLVHLLPLGFVAAENAAHQSATGVDDDNVNLTSAFIPAQSAIHQQIDVSLNTCITHHSQDSPTPGGNF